MIKKIGDPSRKGRENRHIYDHPVKVTKKAHDKIKEALPYVRKEFDDVGMPVMYVTISAAIEWIFGQYINERKRLEGKD